jgi:hypothetical protein
VAPKHSLSSFSRETLKGSDRGPFFAELTGASDRACVILCGAMVDHQLVIALQTKMKALTRPESDRLFFEQAATLGTMSSRIDLAYALDLITEEAKRSSETLRRIRNTFAHALWPISFEHPLITKECQKLPTMNWLDSPQMQVLNKHRKNLVQVSSKIATDLAKVSQAHPRFKEIMALVDAHYVAKA